MFTPPLAPLMDEMPPASPLANESSFGLPQEEKSASERKIAKT
jgi:hypothetical protein